MLPALEIDLAMPLPPLRFLAAWLAFAAPGAAPAQETGSRIDPYRGAVGAIESEDARTARRVMVTFGRCVARNRSRLAESVLALPLYSSEQQSLARQTVGGEDGCLGIGDRELRFPPTLLVGAMAEQFIVTRFDGAELGAIAALTDEGQSQLGLDPRTGYEAVAICVARRNPAAVRTLVRTRPASDDEAAAIDRLVADLGPCLPAGNEYRFNRASLRALLAAGLYRVMAAMAAR